MIDGSPRSGRPRLRPGVDAVEVESPDGEPLICLYDRQDPSGGQLVVTRAGLLLASLMDGGRTIDDIRDTVGRQAGVSLPTEQIEAFIDRLDRAHFLDSDRYQAHVRDLADQLRRAPSRPAVHAGGAYPGDPGSLRAFLDARYTMAGGPGARPVRNGRPSPRGLLAPHIDLHRGGHSYAWGYRALAEAEPADLYVVLGTCHQPMRRPFAATAVPYDTPFGPVTADPAFLDRLQARAPFDIFEDELSHRREHSLEFQAVYLRYLEYTGGSPAHRPPAPVVPILCVPPGALADGATPRDDAATEETIAALSATIAEDGRRVCIIAGADFAHVGPQFGDPAPVDRAFAEQVRIGDLAMLEQIVATDADGFYRQVVDEQPGTGMAGDSRAVGGPRRICGLAPIYAMLRLLEGSAGQTLHYDQWIDQGGTESVTFGCVAFE